MMVNLPLEASLTSCCSILALILVDKAYHQYLSHLDSGGQGGRTFFCAASATRCLFLGGTTLLPFLTLPASFLPPEGVLALSLPAP